MTIHTIVSGSRLGARGLAAVCVLGAGLGLAGCRSAYDVDVRNLTDQPITAQLTRPFGDGADVTLRQTRIGPGDRGSMFVQRDSSEQVKLIVDFDGNVGYPGTLDLVRGKTIVNVKRREESPGSKGSLLLEEVARP